MSKGSSPRPKSVDAETFGNNWDAIFGKKEKKTEFTWVCPKCNVDRLKEQCPLSNNIPRMLKECPMKAEAQ